jgi:hypothetical protein
MQEGKEEGQRWWRKAAAAVVREGGRTTRVPIPSQTWI